MFTKVSAAAGALALLLAATPGQASAPAADPLASLFVQYFFRWKSEPADLQVSNLKLLSAGGELRVMCGTYDLPGQARRPFLVLGDSAPSASAAWEPGSFPENDPLYPQLMQDLRLCQSLGETVSALGWRAPARTPPA